MLDQSTTSKTEASSNIVINFLYINFIYFSSISTFFQPVLINNRQIHAENDPNNDLVHLPIMVILTHNVTLTYFTEYLNQVGGQNYIHFFMSIEVNYDLQFLQLKTTNTFLQGFKTSVDHQVRGCTSGGINQTDALETIKEAALYMYHQYLSFEVKFLFGNSILQFMNFY